MNCLQPPDFARLAALLASCKSLSITVVGDLMLDEYIEGVVERISPEAPVPIVKALNSGYRLGGAGNVARQLRALGARVTLAGVVGDDSAGLIIKRLCTEAGIDTASVLTVEARSTTRKLRVLGQNQQLLRIDWETQRPLSDTDSNALLACLGNPSAMQGLILSDYAKGVLTDKLLAVFGDDPRYRGLPIIVDPKRRDFTQYRGARVITPNLKELCEAVGQTLHVDEPDRIAVAAKILLEQLSLEAIVVTLGDKGMLVVDAESHETLIPALRRPVYDVTGAGDTAAAVITACLAAGASVLEAATVANIAAGIAVSEIGAVAVPASRIISALTGQPAGKLLTRAELASQAKTWHAAGRRVVFTNGCFDLLHPGHLSLLQFAKSLADVLVLAINSDSAVRRLKGPARPVVPECDRAALLGALECVDAVTIFDEDTPLDIIRCVLPDVLVKGQDYKLHEVVGRDLVESAGGRVVLAPLFADYSTTRLLSRARA